MTVLEKMYICKGPVTGVQESGIFTDTQRSQLSRLIIQERPQLDATVAEVYLCSMRLCTFTNHLAILKL